MHRKGGYLGLPGLDPAPSGPQIDPKSIENRPRIDPTSTLETVIILAACRSSYCMSFILFHVVHLIGRLSQRSSTRIYADHLTAGRSYYLSFVIMIINSNLTCCMSFLLSVVRHNDHHFEPFLVNVVRLCCRRSLRTTHSFGSGYISMHFA